MKFENDNITLDLNSFYNNFIYLNDAEFELRYLDDKKPYNKGASSNIFLLVDPSDEDEDRVIKICKTHLNKNGAKNKKKRKRFQREIKAFNLVKTKGINGVIDFFGDGEVEIDGYKFLYIVLEKADNDLADYLKINKFNFTVNQKFNFCANLVANFEELHKIGIYHRDIKHDNIFCVSSEFKIGDLGLVTFREKDFSIDFEDEKVGPVGWLSPEATNKMLSKNNSRYSFDCIIDDKSDVFQLGKLFWYIFQGNIPTGQLEDKDCLIGDPDIYNILSLMLQYSKTRRPSISQVNTEFLPIRKKLFV